MIRELFLLVLLFDATLFAINGYWQHALVLVLVAFFVYKKKLALSHLLQKELNFISAKLFRLILVSCALCSILFFSELPTDKVFEQFIAFNLAVLPLLMLLALQKKVSQSTSELGQFRSIRFIRIVLQINFAQLILIALGLIALLTINIQPFIHPVQVIALAILLFAPLVALQSDKSTKGLLKVNDRNLRAHTLGIKNFKTYAGYGFIAALLSAINYLLVFYINDINPKYIDPSLPLHQQATTLALGTLMICMVTAVLFERVDKHHFFINKHTLDNKKLLKAFGVSFIILALVSYVPSLQFMFNTQALGLYDWILMILAAGIYSALRMAHRHTRKHTRHSVLELYKKHGHHIKLKS